MTAAINRWMPGLTLTAWSGVLIFFYSTGRVKELLVPAFRPWVMVAGIVLLCMAAVMLMARREVEECCADEVGGHSATSSTGGRFLTLLILLVPLLAAAGLSQGSFSITTVKNRGLVTEAAGLSARPRSMEPPLPTKSGEPAAAVVQDYNAIEHLPRTDDGYVMAEVIDFLYAAEEPDLRSDFEGHTLSVIGQWMPDEETNAAGNRFKLVRMFMNCCAADARPVAVSVEAEQPTGIPEMSWVRVIGAVEFPLIGGTRKAVLKAQRVEKTSPPEEAMLF